MTTGRAVAFLFTDIEASSIKWLRYGDAMRAALEQHDRLMRAAIEGSQGLIFKTAGDAFYGAFRNAVNALNAAVDAQRSVECADWSAVGGLAVRMAIHEGEASQRDGDYFGPALNCCARLLVLGHGGQILLTQAVARALSSVASDMSFPRIGLNALDDPDIEEPIHQVVATGLRRDFPPLRNPSAIPNNLPHTLPSLFGRESEIDRIQEALERSRWVTLTGIGGIGKTRLALEVLSILTTASRGSSVANSVRGRIEDGAWLIDLSVITDGKRIATTIATELGIELPGARSPLPELVDRLRSRSLILLLDNCEHLLDAVGQLGFVLMAQCPRVLVLATSQDLVEVPTELPIAIGELPLPARNVTSMEEAMHSPAAKLFAERAIASDPAFILLDRDAPALAEICHALDGIALAIEMAASRAATFGIVPLARRLTDHLGELEGRGDGPSRHQTLKAAIDWSHSLLARREKILLRRLAVFAGGFSMEDAITVARDDELEEVELINALAELVRRSLVARDQARSEPRYRLLQTVLAYSREKLGEANETAEFEARLLSRMTEVGETGFKRSWELADWLLRETYEPDLANIRVALDRGFSSSSFPLVMRLAGSMQPLLAGMGLLAEARERLEFASSHSKHVDGGIAARVWLGLGLAIGFSHPARAVESLARAEQHYRSAGGLELAQLLVMKGRLSQVVAGYEAQSRELLAEAGPLIASAGNKRLLGHFYRGLGNQCLAQGRADEGVAMMYRSAEAFREAGAEGAASNVRTSLGYLLWASGKIDEAISQCREVLDEIRAQTFIDNTVLGFVLGNLAGMLSERGDLDEAAELFSEAAPLLRDPWQIWVVYDHIAHFLGKRERFEDAARASAFVDREYAEHKAARQPNEARAHVQLLVLLQHRLDPARLDDLRAEGAAMTREDAVALAASAVSGTRG